MYNPFSLEGKTILITGASSGIGRATAVVCSKLGAKVVVCARKMEALDETLEMLEGYGHCKIVAELSSEDELKKVVEDSPMLDGVVLCAGKGLTLPFSFCTREKYDDVFGINFFSPVETLRLLIKKHKLSKGASAVVVASIAGTVGGRFSPGNCVYGASKAAVSSVVKYAAVELASKGVRVNAVNPGMTNTKLIHNGTLTDEQLKADMDKVPLKRYGEPADIANGIVYLLSDASSWVTGHALVVDGGISI